MSQTILEPEIQNPGTQSGRWMVVIFNNDHTGMDVVMEALMRATGCDKHEAYIEMWEAHTFGKAPVHFANKSECETAAAIIETVGVRTEVSLEWAE